MEFDNGYELLCVIKNRSQLSWVMEKIQGLLPLSIENPFHLKEKGSKKNLMTWTLLTLHNIGTDLK